MYQKFIKQSEGIIGQSIDHWEDVRGGDTSSALKLVSGRRNLFLKYLTSPTLHGMYQKEVMGLKLISMVGCVKTPKIIGYGTDFLLLEFIDDEPDKNRYFWQEFAADLAKMHRQSWDKFGLDHSNFIGQLPQSNTPKESWSAFYAWERLIPQLKMAVERSIFSQDDTAAFESLCRKVSDICPEEPPALIHGDLWSGNFLCNQQREVVLIDPAVSFAHREMDLAMSRLFGGFPDHFYKYYEEHFPLQPGFEQRCSFYQLYYLMVHLNLFGSSYLPSVRQILRRYA
ncbi:MAG: fructosamine kinase family protein [Bacteroidota bacterium]